MLTVHGSYTKCDYYIDLNVNNEAAALKLKFHAS